MLAPIRYRKLGWTLDGKVAIISREGMSGKAIDEAPTFDPTDCGAPTKTIKCPCDGCSESKCGVAPQVFGTVGPINFLFIIERLDRFTTASIRRAEQNMWQDQADVLSIRSLSKALPASIVCVIENLI